MTSRPQKAKINEYRPAYYGLVCHAEIKLTSAEVRCVNETPEIKWWWEEREIEPAHTPDKCPYKYHDRQYKNETHYKYCYPEVPRISHNRAWCELSNGHDGSHIASVGICENDTSKDIWITWITGAIGSRKLAQPGTCPVSADDSDDDICLLAAGHSGMHYLQYSLYVNSQLIPARGQSLCYESADNADETDYCILPSDHKQEHYYAGQRLAFSQKG